VKKWKNATGGIAVAWRQQGWYVNMFEIASVDKQEGSISWADSDGMPQGGWQGGRGWQLNGTTGAICNEVGPGGEQGFGGGTPCPPLYFENIFEELDAPNEWYTYTVQLLAHTILY
jgi:hypothetical protein